MEEESQFKPCCREKIRVLELYSGVGGMHLALKESGLNFEVVAAVDINTVTNAVYKHNFPEVYLKQRSIESLSLKELNKLSPDMILMSPPCQPFTRVGKKKDSQDIRTTSFFHVLEQLPKFAKPPRYILVENVKGFDISQTRASLIETLQASGYHIQEFLLSPLQFGIPNSRLRYYLVAKKTPLEFKFPTQDEIHESLPECALPFCIQHQAPSVDSVSSHNSSICSCLSPNKAVCQSDADIAMVTQTMETQTNHMESQCTQSLNHRAKSISSDSVSEDCSELDNNSEIQSHEHVALHKKYSPLCSPIRDYLEKKDEEFFKPYLLPEKFYKTFWVADIVKAGAQNSCCFTKRYGHHMDGAGSLVQMNENPDFDLVKFKDTGIYGEEAHELVRALKLRYFTPREIANLLCFPAEFSFPPDLSLIQCYRVLGNSLNVHVASILLKLLTWEQG